MWIFSGPKLKAQLKKPFSSKYTLTVDTDMKAGGIVMTSKSKIRWQMDVKNIREEFADVNILLLQHRLLESNNPLMKDMAGFSNIFNQMYSEIELTVNEKAEIVKIRNLEGIQKKWQWIKQDMQKFMEDQEGFKEIIRLNDELFSTPAKIKTAIETGELFGIYFHYIFGVKLPYTKSGIEKNNWLNTARIKWSYDVGFIRKNSNPSDEDLLHIVIKGYPQTTLSKSWIQDAYKAYAHLPVEKSKPEITENGQYKITPYGKVLHAKVEKSETALPKLLYVSYRYELKAEDEEQ